MQTEILKDMQYAIGIDLGGTSVKYALISSDGSFLFEGKLPSRANVSAEAVIGQLLTAVARVKEFAAGQPLPYPIAGIGLGTPGIVDATSRIVLGGAENICGWENLYLADRMEAETGLPTYLGNDANLMGLGETLYGAGRGATDIVFLTVGTGIGGAVMIDGKLFTGFGGRGTELGHVPLMANGEACACGSVGCLEHYASTSALVRRFGQRMEAAGERCTGAQYAGERCMSERYAGQEIDGELIVRLYKEGDELATACLDEHCNYLGQGIAGFINIFSPQRVVVGGGLSEAGAFYIDKVSACARRYAIHDCAVNTEIRAAQLGNRAGSIGAAGLVFAAYSSHHQRTIQHEQ